MIFRAICSLSPKFKSGNIFPVKNYFITPVGRDKEIPIIPDEVLCCGSGCQNCVWLEYAEKLLNYYGTNYASSNEGIHKAISEIEKLNDQNLKSFLLMEMRMKLK